MQGDPQQRTLPGINNKDDTNELYSIFYMNVLTQNDNLLKKIKTLLANEFTHSLFIIFHNSLNIDNNLIY